MKFTNLLLALVFTGTNLFAQFDIAAVEQKADSLDQVLKTISPNDTAQFAILEELAYMQLISLMNPEDYIKYMETYLERAKALDSKPHLARVYGRFVYNYSFENEALFLERTREALDYFEQIKDTIGIIEILASNSLYARQDLSDNEQSLKYIKEAWELCEDIGCTEQLPMINLYFAMTLTCIEDYERALPYLDKVLSSNKVLNHMKVDAYDKKAVCHENLAQYDSVAYFYEQSLALSLADEDLYSAQYSYGGLADFYLSQGDIDQAKYYYDKIEPLAKLNDCDCTPLADNYQQIGIYYKDKGTVDSAVVFFNKSIEQAEFERQFNEQVLINNRVAHLALSEIYESRGEYQEAMQELKQYHLYKDSLISTSAAIAAEDFDMAYGATENAKKVDVLSESNALLNAQNQAYLIAVIGIGLAALVSLFSFLTSRRQNRIITEQKEQLEQLNLTKDRIFAIIGHDMRKPALAFRGIGKKVNYLLKKQDYTTLRALGNEIEKDALALDKLTNNLLNWALTQKDVMPYNPQSIVLADLLEEVISVFSLLAKDKQIRLSSDVSMDLKVNADRNALLTIARNLVDNAIKYTPKGGEVRVGAVQEGEHVRLRVEDTGVGISEEKLKHIFLLRENKSETGTAGEKGTGLGLHLINELVKLNKGTINVVSQLGQGTHFNVILPA